MTTRSLLIVGIVCAGMLATASIGSALTITATVPPYPADFNPDPVLSGSDTSQSDIDIALEGYFVNNYSDPISILYKKDYGIVDSGVFATSYETTFNSDASAADISFVSPPKITSSPTFLLVKDGNQNDDSPFVSWYLFDITGYNGTETINLTGFWDGTISGVPRPIYNGQGSISHVSIYGNIHNTPDGGSTVALLGMVIGLLGAVRRKMSI